MTQWLYTVQAKEIQSYILQSSRLKDMVGASEIVEQLTTSFLESTLTNLKIDRNSYSSMIRAAGHARILFKDESGARSIHSLFPLLASRFAPGLKIIQALQPVENESDLTESMSNLEKELRMKRNMPVQQLPEASPVTERNPRTGNPAIELRKERGVDHFIDRVTSRKEDYNPAIHGQASPLNQRISGPQVDLKSFRWPLNIEDMTLNAGGYVAVIHADGNGFGKIILSLQRYCNINPDKTEEVFLKFSKVVEESSTLAAQSTFQEIILADYNKRDDGKRGFIGCRPIVLGGDDFTVITRADLAIPFINHYLKFFETESKKALVSHLKHLNIPDLPEYLTACAGVAFVKVSYPFDRAQLLAESLCRFSKRRSAERTKANSESIPSTISFHRVTSSLTGDFENDIIPAELTSRTSYQSKRLNNNQKMHHLVLVRGPYSIHPDQEIPHIDEIMELSRSLMDLPSGPIRSMINLLYESQDQAMDAYRRVQLISREKGREKQFKQFEKALCRVNDCPEREESKEENREILFNINDRGISTPLLEALTLKGFLSP